MFNKIKMEKEIKMNIYDNKNIKDKQGRGFVLFLLLVIQAFVPFVIPTNIVEAQTTTIFEDKFESNNLNAWDNSETTYGEKVGTSSSSPYEGRYHATFSVDGSGSSDEAYVTKNVELSEIYVNGYFNPSNGLPLRDNNDRFDIIRVEGNGQTIATIGVQRISGIDRWLITARHGSGWKGASHYTNSVNNRWYKIELHWVKSSSSGLAEVSVDGNKILRLTSLDSDNYGNVDKVHVGFIRGSGIQQDMVLYCDYLRISSVSSISSSTSTSTSSTSTSSTSTSSTSTSSTSTSSTSTTSTTTYSQGGVIFEDDFESNSLRAWDDTEASYGETLGTKSSSPYQGKYHASFSTDGSGSRDEAYITKKVNENDIYVSGFFYPVNGLQLRDEGDRFDLIQIEGNGQIIATIGVERKNGADNWLITARHGSGWRGKMYYSSSVSAKWYKVELHWVKGSSNGLAEVSIDGRKILSLTSLDTDNFGEADKVNVGFLKGTSIQQDLTVYCDIVKISSTGSTSSNTSTSSDTSSDTTDNSSDSSSGSTSTSTSSTSSDIKWATRNENGLNSWTVGGSNYGQTEYRSPYSTLSVVNMLGKTWIRSRIDNPKYASDDWSTYKCRAEIMRKGNLNQDGSWIKEENDIYYGVRIYLPSNFRVDTGSGSWKYGASLIQLHEGTSLGWGGGLRIWSTTQTFRIVTHHYKNGNWVYEELAKDIPYILGRPFTVIFHVRATQNGVFEAWIDGKLVARDYDDYRMCPDSQRAGYISRYLQVGLYCGIDQNVKEMYFTDAVVATSYQAVTNFLN